MNIAPNNATSYQSNTYNFLKPFIREEINKRAARRVDLGTSWGPLGRLGHQKSPRKAKEKERKERQAKGEEKGGDDPKIDPKTKRQLTCGETLKPHKNTRC